MVGFRITQEGDYMYLVTFTKRLAIAASACCLGLMLGVDDARAAKVTVELGDAKGITTVGAIARWDKSGNHTVLPDEKAKIDAPRLDAQATNEGSGRWVFKDLKPGKYDLLIMAEGKLRIEGFEYAPVKEFDPFFKPTTKVEDEEARDWIVDDIKKSKHYENKVEPLYLGGDKKMVRILVMLIRDQADQLHARRRHHPPRNLAIHLELRRLAEGETHQGAGPRAHASQRPAAVDLALGPETRRDRGQGFADHDQVHHAGQGTRRRSSRGCIRIELWSVLCSWGGSTTAAPTESYSSRSA